MAFCVADDGFNEELTCSLCLDSWRRPKELKPCGHIFCSQCVLVNERLPNHCPVCRADVEAAQAPHRSLVNMSLKVPVTCSACQWKGTREASYAHNCPNAETADCSGGGAEPGVTPAPPGPSVTQHGPSRSAFRVASLVGSMRAPATLQPDFGQANAVAAAGAQGIPTDTDHASAAARGDASRLSSFHTEGSASCPLLSALLSPASGTAPIAHTASRPTDPVGIRLPDIEPCGRASVPGSGAVSRSACVSRPQAPPGRPTHSFQARQLSRRRTGAQFWGKEAGRTFGLSGEEGSTWMEPPVSASPSSLPQLAHSKCPVRPPGLSQGANVIPLELKTPRPVDAAECKLSLNPVLTDSLHCFDSSNSFHVTHSDSYGNYLEFGSASFPTNTVHKGHTSQPILLAAEKAGRSDRAERRKEVPTDLKRRVVCATSPTPWLNYNMTEAEYNDAKEAFDHFDTRKKGFLDQTETAQLARWMNFTRTVGRGTVITEERDGDGGGPLSLEGLLTWMKRNPLDTGKTYNITPVEYKKFLAKFHAYDRDHDGWLHANEFSAMCLALNEFKTEDEAMTAFNAMDLTSCGTIDLHTFLLNRAARKQGLGLPSFWPVRDRTSPLSSRKSSSPQIYGGSPLTTFALEFRTDTGPAQRPGRALDSYRTGNRAASRRPPPHLTDADPARAALGRCASPVPSTARCNRVVPARGKDPDSTRTGSTLFSFVKDNARKTVKALNPRLISGVVRTDEKNNFMARIKNHDMHAQQPRRQYLGSALAKSYELDALSWAGASVSQVSLFGDSNGNDSRSEYDYFN